MNLPNQILLTIDIRENAKAIWKVLTDPETFNKCFPFLLLDCQSWAQNEKIYFRVKDTNHVDTAIITEIIDYKILSYNYFKENFAEFQAISFEIIGKDNHENTLKLTASNFRDKAEYDHSESAWTSMLNQIKRFLEE